MDKAEFRENHEFPKTLVFVSSWISGGDFVIDIALDLKDHPKVRSIILNGTSYFLPW